MEKNYEKLYLKVEKKHWWFLGHRDLINKLLRNARNKKILEIGCGSGLNLKELSRKNTVVGIDNSKFFIKNKNIKNIILGDANKLPFKKESFDYILCLDIIEHIEYDNKLIKEIKNLLKPKGKLILTVPAIKILYGPHDITNKHYRRYNKAELLNKLNKAGFKDIRISYWNSALFPPVFGVKILNKFGMGGKSNIISTPKIVNKILFKILKIENKLILICQ